MSDFTRTTHQSWFERLSDSIKSVLFGLVIFVISFPLLWWNEGRAVKTARSLKEGATAVVSVLPNTVDAANQDRLIHLSAEADTAETLHDPEFGISATAIKLERIVEMYQWKEEEQKEKKKKTGGGTTTTTRYSYSTVWTQNLIDSSSFAKPEGHQNPSSLPYESTNMKAENVHAGAFRLSAGLISQISAWEPMPVSELPGNAPPAMQVNGGQFYIGTDPAKPEVGDVQIRFRRVPPTIVSIVARQDGDQLRPYPTKAGRELEMLEHGMHSADEMFSAAEARNTTLTWILRAVGWFLMFLGIMMIFRPLVIMADVLPILGNILGAGLGLFAFVVAGTLALITIALAWIAFRPLLGVALLALAVTLIVVGVRIAKKRKPELPPIPQSE